MIIVSRWVHLFYVIPFNAPASVVQFSHFLATTFFKPNTSFKNHKGDVFFHRIKLENVLNLC